MRPRDTKSSKRFIPLTMDPPRAMWSLSDAALQAVADLGYTWPSASGAWEWTHQGKRLDELRRAIEEQAD